MHTEHLQNVGLARVITSWLVAAAMTSLAAFVLIAIGLLTDEPGTGNTIWSTAAVAIGFFAGGMFAGFRAIQAPILHAIGIGLTSLVVWFVVNALSALLLPVAEWTSMTPGLAVGLLLTQLLSAMVGALLGYNLALRGKPGLAEHEPVS